MPTPDEAGRSSTDGVVRAAFWSTYLLATASTVVAFRGGWRSALVWYLAVAPASAFAVAGCVSLLARLRERVRPTSATTAAPAHPRQRRRSDAARGRVHDALAEAAAAKTRVGAQGLVDPLTGVLSREGLVDVLQDLSPPYAVTLVTLDRFGHIVEREGAAAAERAMREVADVLRRGRAEDVVARWADCELMLVLPGTTASEGTARVQRLLAEAHATVHINDRPLGLSAAIADAAVDASFDATVAQAEQAMSTAEPRLIVAR